MKDKNNAVILVDVQNDFLTRGVQGKGIAGSLAVAGADDEFIKQYIEHVALQVVEENVRYLAITKDWHEKGHASFATTWNAEQFSNIKVDDKGNAYFTEKGETYKVTREQGAKLQWDKESKSPTNLSEFEKVAKDKVPALLEQTLWPEHCLQRSEGSELHPTAQAFVDFLKDPAKATEATKKQLEFLAKETLEALGKAQGIEIQTFLKGDNINQECYAGTGGHLEGSPIVDGGDKKLDQALADRNIGHVFVGGVALDYCVCGTASGLQNSSIIKDAGIEVVVENHTTKAVNHDAGILKLLEMATNGIEISDDYHISTMLESLSSTLPLEMAIVANQKDISVIKDVGAVLSKLPKFSELDAATRSQFVKIYAKELEKNHTGIAELDVLKIEMAYLRFISQDRAEKSMVPGLLPKAERISLKEWRMISQEVFGDTGVNISIPGVIGKRDNGKKYGALAGGLGEKLTEYEYRVTYNILKAYKESSSPEMAEDDLKLVKKLEQRMLTADNVAYDITTGHFAFLDRSKPEELKKIQAATAVRELVEELAEGFISDYLLQSKSDKKQTLAEIMSKAAGKELSPQAIAIFTEMAAKVDEFWKDKDFKNPDAKKEYKDKIYKTSIEPLFAKFLKHTEEGQKLLTEVHQLISAQKVTSSVINDLSFPKERLRSILKAMGASDPEIKKLNDKQKKENALKIINDPKRPTVLIPETTSYVVNPALESLLAKFSQAAVATMDKAGVTDLCVECNGFKKYPSAMAQAVDVLVQLGNGAFTYAHEGFIQAKAALNVAWKEAKIRGLSPSAFDEEVTKQVHAEVVKEGKDPKEFQDGFNKQMQKLVDGNMHLAAYPEISFGKASQMCKAMLIGAGDKGRRLLDCITAKDKPDLRFPDVASVAQKVETETKVKAEKTTQANETTKETKVETEIKTKETVKEETKEAKVAKSENKNFVDRLTTTHRITISVR